jgi:hypothetical protein
LTGPLRLPHTRIRRAHTKVNATLTAWTGFEADKFIGRRLHQFLNMPGRIYYETHIAPLLRMQGFFNEFALDFETAAGERLPVIANPHFYREERIGASNQRKFFCENDFSMIRRKPRCRQSVAQNGLILESLKGGLWTQRSMPGW